MNTFRFAVPEDFDRIYALLEASFPKDEYRPREAQKALLKEPNYTAYVLADSPGQEIQAVITLWRFADFAFIEHFAVSEKYRNQGLGAKILETVRSFVPCPLCLEVELPDTALAARRISFYERNGFFVNTYPYVQPSYDPDRKPVPLWILTSGAPVSQEQFENIRAILYKQVYRTEE